MAKRKNCESESIFGISPRHFMALSLIVPSLVMLAILILGNIHSRVNTVQYYKHNITAAKKENAMCNMLPINPKTNLRMIQKGDTLVPISETMAQDCRNANIATFN